MKKYPNLSEDFVSLKTLARQWDMDKSTVLRILRRAGIRAYHLSGQKNGLVRFRKSEVEAYLAAQTSKN